MYSLKYQKKYQKYKKLYNGLKAGAHITERLLDGRNVIGQVTAALLDSGELMVDGIVYKLSSNHPQEYRIKITKRDGEEINIENLTNIVNLGVLKKKIQDKTGLIPQSYKLMSDSDILDNNTFTLTNELTNINLVIENYVNNIISIKDDWIRIPGRSAILKSSSKSEAIFKIIFNDGTTISANGHIQYHYGDSVGSVWSFDKTPDENQTKHIISYIKEKPERSEALNELLHYLQPEVKYVFYDDRGWVAYGRDYQVRF